MSTGPAVILTGDFHVSVDYSEIGKFYWLAFRGVQDTSNSFYLHMSPNTIKDLILTIQDYSQMKLEGNHANVQGDGHQNGVL